MNPSLLQAAGEVFGRVDLWLIIVAAACYGIFVGAIPGLTATMAVALFVPVAYWLDPVAAIGAIVTMVACAIFAGDIPTVLLRIPGTPASAAYADQAYRLTEKGLAHQVLSVSLVSSVVGGVIGAVLLMVLGNQFAAIASWFSVTEYFWLYLIGLSCCVLVAPVGTRWKALLSLILGILLSTVGLSAVHLQPRFTFQSVDLYQGISFISAMIGLFGLSEVFANLASAKRGEDNLPSGVPMGSFGAMLRSSRAAMVSRFVTRPSGTARSSLMGVLIGMLPGAGADIASWVTFAAAKRGGDCDADQELVDAIGDATTANSAALAGGWIPTLVFGIPGDSVTAIVIGVLLMKNVTPGPAIFENQPSLVYGIYLIFLIANLVMLPIGMLAIRLGLHLVRIPKQILLPVIVLFCVTGAYSLNGSLFDVTVMLVMGLAGFILNRRGFPLGPVVLGLVLGGPLEERLIQALTASGGNPLGLLNRPIAVVLAVATLLIIVRIVRRPERVAP
ncbi:Tripartite tricarboxylate transporter TctA family protein [Stieleria maiorica]|uniref:Tripartite tricarboxylate transporter TctA family protein n=1 Tax=Stieleria maiorica TaxID=2795974 RepID=A0A5B9MNL7_9BACT|nr:tripartite tricarboxylate transporter permease [Stieleria maiorica]QEG01930.1 Tripartite tricarboxylate transporter TctA family protein [Stieleria maiorica]